jgi:hypothetical protein
LSDKGANFNLAVNFCDVAAQALDLDDSGCEKDRDVIWKYLEKVRIRYKFVTHYFNPELFIEDKQTMDWIGV